MRLVKSPTANINYLAKIVNIKEFRKHNDPEVTKLKCCTIDGFNMITGIDSEPGLYVYFPALSQINPDFLRYANLYRHKELNADETKSGMFDDNGRVKAIRLRGEISEGFIIPITAFINYILSVTNKELENISDGEEFDSIQDGEKSFWINKKYIPKVQYSQRTTPVSKHRHKIPKRLDRIREDQFKFHYDTILLRKYPFVLNPDSFIHISYKMHGTSGISAYVLCHQPLNWKQKIAKWLTGESFDKYDYIYSSRSVIKNKYYNPECKSGYYNEDIWAYADKIVRPCLKKGETAYYEIIGFLPSGNYIQKDFDYGCEPLRNNKEEFTVGKNFKVLIYRVTYTNSDGDVHEYSTQEVKQWCERNNLQSVEQCYYGLAKDLYPEIKQDDEWSTNFINTLANDKKFYMECNSPHCNNKVPHEGVVIKIEDGRSRAFKLKTFAFLGKEQILLDKGETNIEDEV